MLVVALMVLSTVLAVVISAAPTAAAAPAGTAAYGAAAGPAPPTASGTVTYNPTTFGTATTTIVVASGGTFGSGSKVYFYASTTNAASGILDPSAPLGSVTLPGGATSLSSTVVSFTTVPPSAVYLLASDSEPSTTVGAQFTVASPITVVATQPTVVSPGTLTSAVTVGSAATITGAGWDAGATVVVTLNSPGGTPQLATATVLANGEFKATFTVPALSGTVDTSGVELSTTTPYNVVVQETNAVSASFPQGGITTDTTMDVGPSITIAPGSFSGASGTVFSITGAGFAAGQSVSASTSLATTSSITIGGVDTYHALITVAPDGSFKTSATLSAAIANSASVGPVSVVITATSPSATDTFQDAVYVSAPNPSVLGFAFTVSGTAYPGTSVTAAVWNFPAGATVTVSLGPAIVGTITTDSNGFGELPATAMVPAMPAGSYTPTAADASAGLYVTATAVSVKAFFSVLDPAGSYLTVTAAEYFPSAGVYTVEGYGLSPTTSYVPTDTGASSSAGIMSVSVGTLNAAGTAVYPALNGTAIFSYTPAYTGTTTGTTETVALGAITPVPSAFGYVEFGAPTFTAPTTYEIYAPGATAQSLSLGNLIPNGATVYPGSAGVPAASYEYSAYFASTLLSLGPAAKQVFHGGTTAPATFASTFTVPTLTNGVYSVSIVSAGTPVSAALSTQSVIVSTTGTSVSAGQLLLIPNTAGTGYDAVGVGLLGTATAWKLMWMTSSGLVSVTETVAASGAFADTTSGLETILTTTEPAGNYAVFVEVTTATATGFIYPTPATYTISAALTLAPSGGAIGSTAAFSATGLVSYGFYDLYFNGAVANFAGTPVTQVQANGVGSITSVSFTVPTLMPGIYTVTLDASGTTTVVASAHFTIKDSTSITLFSGGADAAVAFPNELVSFSWTPATAPAVGVPVEVTVLLNGTAYTTEPAVLSAGTLSGSFLMPNAPAGTYFEFGLEWTQTVVSGGGSSTTSYTATSPTFLQLVSGSGALVISVSHAQIVQIATLTGAYVNVTLASLGAKITTIANGVASLSTAFGNMTASLAALNAKVTSVASGVADLNTTLGTISATLKSLEATISTFNGTVVKLESIVGTLSGTLSSINATVHATAVTTAQINANVNSLIGMVVYINSTALAGITGQLGTIGSGVTSIQGTVTAISGNIATIQTGVGTLLVNASSIQGTLNKVNSNTSSTPNVTTYLIIVIVLAIIAIVVGLLAVMRVNAVARRLEQDRGTGGRQEPPSGGGGSQEPPK